VDVIPYQKNVSWAWQTFIDFFVSQFVPVMVPRRVLVVLVLLCVVCSSYADRGRKRKIGDAQLKQYLLKDGNLGKPLSKLVKGAGVGKGRLTKMVYLLRGEAKSVPSVSFYDAVEAQVRRKAQKTAYDKSEKGKVRRAKYNGSEQGKQRNEKFDKSDKGKARKSAYEKSARGKDIRSYFAKQYSKSSNGKEAVARAAEKDRRKRKLASDAARATGSTPKKMRNAKEIQRVADKKVKTR
jgi:hypothetical protein